MKKILLAAAMLAVTPLAAQAQTYSAVGGFSLTNPSPWSYGYGVAGSSFTAMTVGGADCFGVTGLNCYRGLGDSQTVALNTTGSPIPAAGTLTIPTGALYVHPADGLPGSPSDTLIRFTASAAGSYNVNGLFERVSNPGQEFSGNGVLVSIYKNGTQIYSSNALSGPPIASGQQALFGLSNVALAANDTLTFAVNNNNSYLYDGTGFNATITAVPEPASWALMIGGLGVVGVAARRRKRATGAALA